MVELWYRLGGRSGMLVADGYQEMADTFADNMVELHTALKEHMHE